jgi:hypothetical protein
MVKQLRLLEEGGKKTVTIGFRVSERVAELLERLAEEQGSTKHSIARSLMLESLDTRELRFREGDIAGFFGKSGGALSLVAVLTEGKDLDRAELFSALKVTSQALGKVVIVRESENNNT